MNGHGVSGRDGIHTIITWDILCSWMFLSWCLKLTMIKATYPWIGCHQHCWSPHVSVAEISYLGCSIFCCMSKTRCMHLFCQRYPNSKQQRLTPISNSGIWTPWMNGNGVSGRDGMHTIITWDILCSWMFLSWCLKLTMIKATYPWIGCHQHCWSPYVSVAEISYLGCSIFCCMSKTRCMHLFCQRYPNSKQQRLTLICNAGIWTPWMNGHGVSGRDGILTIITWNIWCSWFFFSWCLKLALIKATYPWIECHQHCWSSHVSVAEITKGAL